MRSVGGLLLCLAVVVVVVGMLMPATPSDPSRCGTVIASLSHGQAQPGSELDEAQVSMRLQCDHAAHAWLPAVGGAVGVLVILGLLLASQPGWLTE